MTHIDQEGKAKMVDVGGKQSTEREAVAHSRIVMKPETLQLIRSNQIAKGNVFTVAQIAGIQAAKKTSSLIPLTHPIILSKVDIEFEIEGDRKVNIKATAKCTGQTGVEIEAMIAASVAAVTIYDMCKAVDKGMTIEEIYLLRKSGGKSGVYERKQASE